jgi:hypothetical protein
MCYDHWFGKKCGLRAAAVSRLGVDIKSDLFYIFFSQIQIVSKKLQFILLLLQATSSVTDSD